MAGQTKVQERAATALDRRGAGRIGVAELLHFETPTLTAALPISGDGGIVTGNVKVTAEVRKANDAYLVPRY